MVWEKKKDLVSNLEGELQGSVQHFQGLES